MRVTAINSGMYCKPRRNQSNKRRSILQEQTTPSNEVTFKRAGDKLAVAMCGGIGAAVGGVIGLALGGPIGAIAGATLLGGALAGEQYDENAYRDANPDSFNSSDYDSNDNNRYDY